MKNSSLSQTASLCAPYQYASDWFDRIRVVYRSQRREMIRHIILNKLKGVYLTDYILAQAAQKIPQADRKLFTESVDEELKLLSPSRIASLGVSVEELLRWQKSQDIMRDIRS